MLTAEQFKTDDPNAKHIVIKLETKKTAQFCFEHITQGEYAIRCFQDRNGNGRLDMGAFGPKEPWGVSKNIRPFMRAPRFNEISFSVNENLSNLTIEVK